MSKERADARLSRLLAIVPWVAAHDGPTVEEVCRRFGVGEKDLVADLKLLFMCGVYPFTPDVLIDVDFADGRVWIRMADYFRRPLRLNQQEGLALVAAAEAFLKLPEADPDGALSTALDKLRQLLGVGDDDAVDVELGEAPVGLLEKLTEAAVQRRKVRLDYYSFGRDGSSSRTVRPWKVFNSASQWYLSGWCETAQDERLFRLDRITGAEVTDDTFDGPEPGEPERQGTFHPSPQDPRYVLDLRPEVHWIAEQYPNEAVESLAGSVLRITIRSGQKAWLERLLLRAGPHLDVVEGDPSVGADAARRILARYRAA